MPEALDRSKMISELDKVSASSIMRTPIVYQQMKNPALLRFYYQVKMQPLIDRKEIDGSSPPDLFVGRFGYPKVFIGPLVPPQVGDTSAMGTPENWVGKSVSDIVGFRMQMVRGESLVKVDEVDKTRIAQTVQELAIAKDSAYVEAKFKEKPYSRVRLDDEVQPHGPSAPLENFTIDSVKVDQKVEKAFYDTDLKAADAVAMLSEKGVLVSKIQKAFSAGVFGLKNNRKFVPTRWSITAVDDTISKNNIEEVKDFQEISEFFVYTITAMDNVWYVIFIPSEWTYEMIEAWWPKTTWNTDANSIAIMSSYEPYEGRTTYAEIAGGYYAARLAASEKLKEMKRQCGVLILREIRPGYDIPVGVWQIREHLRLMFKTVSPERFSTFDEALNYCFSNLQIPAKNWRENSKLITKVRTQTKLMSFIRK